jgi:hypothetical protein
MVVTLIDRIISSYLISRFQINFCTDSLGINPQTNLLQKLIGFFSKANKLYEFDLTKEHGSVP